MIKKIRPLIAALIFTLPQAGYSLGFSDILQIDIRELNGEQYEKLISHLDEGGQIVMTRLADLSSVRVSPGSLTPEEGLDFIPDDDEAIDIYIELLQRGTLPFGAVFLTNQVLFGLD